MNGYLLIAACNLDDVPVQMFRTKSAAIAATKRRRPPKNNPLGAWDKSGFVCWKVLRFKGGLPVDVVIIDERRKAA